MSTGTAGGTPIGYSLFTIIGTGVGFVLSSLYGVFGLFVIYLAEPKAIPLGLLFILAFSLARSQDVLKRQDVYSNSESPSAMMTAVTVLLNLFYMSSAVFVATILGAEILATVDGKIATSLAILTITVYAFWEVETKARGLPISLGGALVLVYAIVYLLLTGTHHVLREAWRRRYSAVELLSVSDERPVFHTTQKFN